MALVLPALLARALSEGQDAYAETSGRLLELASADQTAFRGVVGGLGEGQRGFMEEVIRSGRAGGGGKVRRGVVWPVGHWEEEREVNGEWKVCSCLLLLMLLHCFCCGVRFVNMGVFFF